MSLRFTSAAVLLLMLAGCAGLGPVPDAVRVTVSDIRVIDATLLEQLYLVTLRVQNRSERALVIQGGSFDLEINGRDFGSGVSDQQLTVPAFADGKIEIRMVSTVFGMLRLIQGMQERNGQQIDYAISGRFSTQGSLAGVRFQESGEIMLPSSGDLPQGGVGR